MGIEKVKITVEDNDRHIKEGDFVDFSQSLTYAVREMGIVKINEMLSKTDWVISSATEKEIEEMDLFKLHRRPPEPIGVDIQGPDRYILITKVKKYNG